MCQLWWWLYESTGVITLHTHTHTHNALATSEIWITPKANVLDLYKMLPVKKTNSTQAFSELCLQFPMNLLLFQNEKYILKKSGGNHFIGILRSGPGHQCFFLKPTR